MSFIEKDCEECNGEGFWEKGPECSYPASQCCGGCYTKMECEECEGTGIIETEE